MTHSLTATEEGRVAAERDRVAWNLPRSPVPAKPRASGDSADRDAADQQGLDWEGFRARYFPGRRRHDLEAITAYGAYRSSRDVPARQAEKPVPLAEPEPVSERSTATASWEDEGGAIRPSSS
jgi:hypothetical protein